MVLWFLESLQEPPVVKEERHELHNLLSLSSNPITASFNSGYYGP